MNRLYNIRAGDRRGALSVASKELGASLVLLYDTTEVLGLHRVVGAPAVMGRAALVELHYPEPRGDVYFVLQLEPMLAPTWLAGLDSAALQGRAGRPVGAPHSLSWLQLSQVGGPVTQRSISPGRKP
jgi:hypothetical protein